jgi:hypothetical protein
MFSILPIKFAGLQFYLENRVSEYHPILYSIGFLSYFFLVISFFFFIFMDVDHYMATAASAYFLKIFIIYAFINTFIITVQFFNLLYGNKSSKDSKKIYYTLFFLCRILLIVLAFFFWLCSTENQLVVYKIMKYFSPQFYETAENCYFFLIWFFYRTMLKFFFIFSIVCTYFFIIEELKKDLIQNETVRYKAIVCIIIAIFVFVIIRSLYYKMAVSKHEVIELFYFELSFILLMFTCFIKLTYNAEI